MSFSIKRPRLTTTLVLTLAVFALIPMCIVGWIAFQTADRAVETLGKQYEYAASNIANAIDRTLFERYSDAQIFGRSETLFQVRNGHITDDAKRLIVETMNHYVETYKIYSLTLLVDPDGRLIAVNSKNAKGESINSEPLYRNDYSQAPWFQALKTEGFTPKVPVIVRENMISTGTFVEDVHLDQDIRTAFPESDGMGLGFSAPIYRDGQVVAYWSNRAQFTFVEDIIRMGAENLQSSGVTDTEITLLDHTGRVLVDFDPSRTKSQTIVHDFDILMNLNLVEEGVSAAKKAVAGQHGYENSLHARKQIRQAVGYSHLKGAMGFAGMNWSILVRVPLEQAAWASRDVQQRVLAAGVVCLLMIPLFGLWAGRRLTARLFTIIDTVKELADGRLTVRTVASGHDELGLLATAVNQLGDQLEQAAAKERSHREELKEKIASATAELRSMTTAIDAVEGIAEFAPDGTILTANKNFLQSLGYQLAEIQGRHHRVLCTTEYAASRDYEAFWAALNRGEPLSGVYMRISKAGNEVWFLACYWTRFDRHGAASKIIKFAIDITAEKQAELDLKQQNLALAEANKKAWAATQAKSAFLASMSHEIRTPMNAIMGMTELLQETSLTTDQVEYVGRLSSASISLLGLINDLLDLSKIEAKRMELESVSFDLHDLVDKSAGMMAIRARSKQLELVALVQPDVPVYVIGDSKRLQQILVNLVGNAIKFTDRGEVVIHVERILSEPDVVRFSIADTGIGIPEDKLQTIFDRFTQVDSSSTRKYGGSGLGLSIAKQLVDLMHGHISVASRPGSGSTFSFTVRLPETPTPDMAPPLPNPDIQGRRILVVDDMSTNRIVVRIHLTKLGAQVIEAQDGTTALTQLEQAKDRGEPIDLVILDYHMPGMNGLELAQAIREQPEYSCLPLVLHVSDIAGESSQRLRALDIKTCTYKPISRTRLLESLAIALGQTSSTPTSTEKPSAEAGLGSSALLPCRILLVEDLEDNRDVVSLFLKDTPYRLEVAENGLIAVEKYQSGVYQLVFMDMQMPVMDGLAATTAIRQWEREQHRTPTPIIALTAHALQEDIDKSMAAGCTAHLTKPIKKKTLLTAIAQYAGHAADQAA